MEFPRTRRPARRWALVAVVLLVAWYLLLVRAFAAREEAWIQVLALGGTMVWTAPAGFALGWLIRRRSHVVWIFPAALPVMAVTLYLAFTSADILPTGNPLDLDPTHMPGRVHVPIAMTVCPFAAAGVAFGFLGYPRPYVNPRRYRCVQCGYDIRESVEVGRCPECGRVLVPGVDYPAGESPKRRRSASKSIETAPESTDLDALGREKARFSGGAGGGSGVGGQPGAG